MILAIKAKNALVLLSATATANHVLLPMCTSTVRTNCIDLLKLFMCSGSHAQQSESVYIDMQDADAVHGESQTLW